MTAGRVEAIRERLQAALTPESVTIEDQSHLHAGHAGAAAGGGHFSVSIVAACFNDLSLLERHRLVYSAVGDMMPGEIHALSIDARTPEESHH